VQYRLGYRKIIMLSVKCAGLSGFFVQGSVAVVIRTTPVYKIFLIFYKTYIGLQLITNQTKRLEFATARPIAFSLLTSTDALQHCPSATTLSSRTTTNSSHILVVLSLRQATCIQKLSVLREVQ